MSKTSFITNITPLPPTITRDVALSYLHDHVEMIVLNPLVLRHKRTSPPLNATEEEQVNCKWYEITDQISYLPGGAAKSEVSYKGGFYDLPYGLQTHVFAPAGVDIKAIWKVGGSMPDEPPEPPELGVNAPKSGLYLREDVELRCSIFLMNFVKRNMRKSHAKLVQDLVSKANDPRYMKARSASLASMPATKNTVGEHRPGCSPVPSTVSQSPWQISRHGTPRQQNDSCSCRGISHEVMCPNYRYSTVSPPKQSLDSQLTPRSEARRSPVPAAASEVNSTDLYSPGGIHSDLASPFPPQSGPQGERQAPKRRSPPYDRYNKPLPAGPPGSSSKATYSSPQLFGEQAELPATTLASERDKIAT